MAGLPCSGRAISGSIAFDCHLWPPAIIQAFCAGTAIRPDKRHSPAGS